MSPRWVVMRGRLIVIGLLVCFASPVCALGQVVLPWASPQKPAASESESVSESQLPLVRARVEDRAEVWVGQAVVLTIEVIVPTWFTIAPAFPELEVKNAVALSPEGTVNFVVQAGGKTFAAQSRRYLIYPQARGRYTVQGRKVAVSYALPDGKPSPLRLLAAPPIRFEARVPPGAEGAKYFLTTDGFQINQSLSRKPDKLQIGDSITRTVTMTAQNTVGISLPPLEFEAPEGVHGYAGAPRILETADRGKLEATRTETTTYIAEKEGKYTLPAITIHWWNPRTKTMNKASVAAVVLRVQGGTASAPEVFASSQAGEEPSGKAEVGLRERLSAVLRWALLCLAAGVFFLVLRRVLGLRGLSLGAYLAERRRRRAEAEFTYFKQFRKASLSGNPKVAFRQLLRWLDHANNGHSASTLKQFVTESRMPGLGDAIKKLEDVLFASATKPEPAEAGEDWSGVRLYKFVAKARRLQKAKAIREHRKAPLMEDMNPSHNERRR